MLCRVTLFFGVNINNNNKTKQNKTKTECMNVS